ncbi:P-loop containing nucleoside triphosphate hydrolase protein [Fomes fomentarius]|nr:P-loop containing nucleoside triphosphate hydrolase protein [Fomes fomentarius]
MDKAPWSIQSSQYQVLLRPTFNTLESLSDSVSLDSRVIPAYPVVASALLVLASLFSQQTDGHDVYPSDVSSDSAAISAPLRRAFFRRKAAGVGGVTIFVFRVVQALAVFALLGLSLAQLVAHDQSSALGDPAGGLDIVRAVQCALFGYLSILGLLSLFGRSSVNGLAYTHLSWILVFAWSAYVYRDIWPLATMEIPPADAHEGPFLWAKLSLLSIAGIIIPVFVPRKYTPVNPKEVLEPNAEQTASFVSLLSFTFLSPVLWLAYQMPHLPFNLFPPLADYDHMRNLAHQRFPRLDPLQNRSRRHISLKLIQVFWVELLHLAAMSVTAVIGAFAAPISTNNLLRYLEGHNTDQIIKPWFWIALLFFGRIFKAVSDQWFMYMTTRAAIRIQALITELVFEHALRVRMKAETSDSDSLVSGENTAVATPETASQLGSDEYEREGSEGDDGETHSGTAHTAASSSATEVDSTTGRANAKGKGKAPSEPAPSSPMPTGSAKAAVEKKGGRNLVGRINNLVSSDLNSLDYITMHFVYTTVEAPLQITLCIVFLYQIMGWSAFVGLASMIAVLPIPGYITKHIRGSQQEKMQKTDERVQFVTEMMGVIRMIKLFGWEPHIASQLDEKRTAELVAVRKNRMLGLYNNVSHYIIPLLVTLTTFFTYAVIMKGTLTAAKVFSAMLVLDMLRENINAVCYSIPPLVQSNVALERIQDFLYNTELIDEYTEQLEAPADTGESFASSVPEEYRDALGIRRAAFSWANDSATQAVTPGGTRRRTFLLQVDDEVIFRRGKLNLVVGPTGAGKTSLLMALLGEMHYIPAGPGSFVNLPRAGGVAYAAQESWVQNDTIRNNIVFGAPFDEVRYKKVLTQCALKRDLELFDAGDQTEVGEKGITLSGGQKARITLARAVYSSAEIVLLDDILAALDVHTSRWIVDKCLKGDLLGCRTIVLVTHNVAMVSPIADFVVGMGSDGQILSQGSLSSALARDSKLLAEIEEEQKELEKADQEVDLDKPEDEAAKQSAGKLVVAEEIESGHLGWEAIALYLGNMAKRPLLFWLVCVVGWAFRHAMYNVQMWYLGYWAAQYEIHPPQEVNAAHYLTVYALTVVLGVGIFAVSVVWYLWGSLGSARIIHAKLVTSILSTTLRWLDKTPNGRIIARCTEDIQTLDTRLARATEAASEVMIFLLMKMGGVVLFSPIFLIPAILVALACGTIGYIFMKAQLPVKREMSNAKAPVLGHFGAAVGGITSIRAYGAQEAFKAESYNRIDTYTRSSILNSNLNRWVTTRVDFIGTLFNTSLAVYLTYFSTLSASNAGFSLALAAAFSNTIFSAVRLETGNVERILQYLLIDHEPEPTADGVPPAYWPASGKLEVEKLSARYSKDGPKVLHDVSFEIASGERVGIVGRTGSGKSSLTLALLRGILTEGLVRYDGLPVDKLNLDALRSNITIIPQVPELLSGTLRQNLDPFSEHDDAVLNDALRSAGLFNLQDENDQSRFTLDSQIAGGGANLSVGQRQILALARAIARRSKLLILDEATSAIDYETDTVIQRSLRTELGRDVTLLTVAHRLQTIMDADKIMVLDAGRIVEFGKPSELLENEKGLLRALVDESGDREKLYAMASGAS